MGTRIPVQHYNIRSAGSFIGSPLHDLNTVDARPGGIKRIGAVERDAVTEDSLDNDEEPSSVDCMHESYGNSLPLHTVGVEGDHVALESDDPSRTSCGILSIEDVSPIETARARFLDVIVDHFLREHVIEVQDYMDSDFNNQSGQDKLSKRKSKETQYEGDSRFVLPLMYVANLYETLVHDVNMRLSSLNGTREKNIGVALEAAGGLYRKLAKKFPRKGPCSFKRRELATSLETRTRFPELVIQEEKRVRFVVVNGLEIVEKPDNMSAENAEWFKCLTGRHEVAVSARDYKFYSPRHKYRRVASPSISSIHGLQAFPSIEHSPSLSNAPDIRPPHQQDPQAKHHLPSLMHEPQVHSVHQLQHQSIHQNQQVPHLSHPSHAQQCAHASHVSDISHTHQSPSVSHQMSCLQPLPGAHVAGRLHVLSTTPAKFCDECGAPYLRETSKFCSECGVKRLGI
ncbi:uncharacterized protein At2g02148 isoform X2 [Nymphaea colorata]|uniref:uncharacterized protein At2g02148 isoform X2 n=1 Tax=Nymphaea colorata TaxID=210225 RepID=UPI00129E4808|nr:uncharacterized protein At2g02148 isoform X2 [Nymphaea colorata]